MGGDQFTQIHNGVFRDARLTPKAMGVFAHLSTHRPGWCITAESVAASMNAGVGAVKSALRELESHHYLIRTQQRHEDGTLGDSVYWYTDLPAQLAAVGITDPDTVGKHVRDTFEDWLAEQQKQDQGRSEPVDENRPSVVTSDDASFPRSQPIDENPPADKPPADNWPPKNTKGKNTKRENTTSSSAAQTPAPAGPASREEEAADSQRIDGVTAAAQELLTSLPEPWRLGPKSVRQLAPLAARALNDGWDPDQLAERLARNPEGVEHPPSCLRARLNDLPDPPAAPSGSTRPSLPKHCGECDPAIRQILDDERGYPVRLCPNCHPYKVAA